MTCSSLWPRSTRKNGTSCPRSCDGWWRSSTVTVVRPTSGDFAGGEYLVAQARAAGVSAGTPAEEGAVSEADAAGVVAGRQARGCPSRGVEARDAPTDVVESDPVGIGNEAAQRERRINGAVIDAEVDGADAAGRRQSNGLQEGRPLVKIRVVAPGHRLVVVVHGAGQSVSWHAEVDGEFLWGRRGECDAQAEDIGLVDHIVCDHVDESFLVAKGVQADAPRVGVLVDESLAVAIDQNPASQPVRWPEGERALEGPESLGRGSGSDAHTDPTAVVSRRTDAPGRIRNVG